MKNLYEKFQESYSECLNRHLDFVLSEQKLYERSHDLLCAILFSLNDKHEDYFSCSFKDSDGREIGVRAKMSEGLVWFVFSGNEVIDEDLDAFDVYRYVKYLHNENLSHFNN